jgi:hypothetical protein
MIYFENSDIDRMTERFTLQELRYERRRAEVHRYTADYFEENTDYWNQYLELVNVSIAFKLDSERPLLSAASGNGVKAADVKARLDIVNVIERYTELRPAGRRFTGKCPIHNDSHPSLVVYPDNNSWHCFGCNRGGDAIDFYQAINKIDFKQAIKELAEA